MRAFVGVDLPGDAKDVLAAFIDRLRAAAPEAKWVPRDNLHLTLAFLGEVGEERAAEIGDALRVAASGLPGPIPTQVHGAGAFPSARRARVVWAGLLDGEGRLAALAHRMRATLEPIGFPPESRSWKPHLTLARFRTPGDASTLVTASPEEVSFIVSDVTLFRSRLARPAPTYEPMGRFPIGG